MSLTVVPDNTHKYQALSSDIVGGSIAGANIIGANVYITDTRQWYQVLPDFTLAELVYNTDDATSGSVAIVSGENIIGKIGQPYTIIPVIPTITAGAYHANDNIGGKLTLDSAMRAANTGGTWQSLLVTDKNNQKTQLNMMLFNYDPVNGTCVDNSAIVLGTDLPKLIRNVTVNASDYQTVSGSIAVADINIMQTVIGGSLNGNLYAMAMTTETPSYASTSDLTFQFGFQQG